MTTFVFLVPPAQGNAVVKALFGTGKKRVAGCAVTDGKMTKAGYVTVKRGKQVRARGAGACVLAGRAAGVYHRLGGQLDVVKAGYVTVKRGKQVRARGRGTCISAIGEACVSAPERAAFFPT